MKLTGRGVFYMSSATTVLGRRGEGERIERGENGERVRCQEYKYRERELRENLSRIERGGDSSKSEVSRIGRRKCPEWTEREREREKK